MKHNKVCIPARKNASKFDYTRDGIKYIIADRPARIAGKLKELLSGKPLMVNGYNCNGYGYQDHDYIYFLTKEEYKAYEALVGVKEEKEKKAKTDEEKKLEWASRLVKLLANIEDITLEEALEIADEKLEYKEEQIRAMEERQYERYSVQRSKLIRKMEKENPLRRIKDAEHAENILIASRRHNRTDYDRMLDEARELAREGEIDRSEVKEYARTHYHRNILGNND